MFRTLFLKLFGGPLLLPVVMAYLIAVLVGLAAALRALLGTGARIVPHVWMHIAVSTRAVGKAFRKRRSSRCVTPMATNRSAAAIIDGADRAAATPADAG